MTPYAIISDTHCHAWDAFATILPTGVNSRLQIILDETQRAAEELKAVGGSTLFHAGDLFHTRGRLAPSVLNPTLDCYRAIIDMGVSVVILAGNHDLENKDANRVSSAITAMEGIGCVVVNEAHDDGVSTVMVPWTPNIADLKAAIERVDAADRPGRDLIIHAPIDGVIKGIPDHGLTDAYLAGLGFRRVFAGHYHHHKDFGNGVYSIGALTQQTWSDVGHKAGFLLIDDKGVHWRASHAPSFVEIDASTPEEEVSLIADGNYVKVTINSAKTGDVAATRSYLMDVCKARGVVVLSDTGATPTVARTGGVSMKGVTIEASIGDFIKAKPEFKRPAELGALCTEILTRARSVA